MLHAREIDLAQADPIESMAATAGYTILQCVSLDSPRFVSLYVLEYTCRDKAKEKVNNSNSLLFSETFLGRKKF